MQAFQLPGLYFTYPVWQQSACGQRGPDNRGCTVLKDYASIIRPKYSTFQLYIFAAYKWSRWPLPRIRIYFASFSISYTFGNGYEIIRGAISFRIYYMYIILWEWYSRICTVASTCLLWDTHTNVHSNNYHDPQWMSQLALPPDYFFKPLQGALFLCHFLTALWSSTFYIIFPPTHVYTHNQE